MAIYAQKHTIKITPNVHKLLKILSAYKEQSVVSITDGILLEELIEIFEGIPELKHHIKN